VIVAGEGSLTKVKKDVKAAEEPQDKAAAQLLARAHEAQRLIPFPAEWSPVTQRRIKQLRTNHFQVLRHSL
jgi:hypothetical protein